MDAGRLGQSVGIEEDGGPRGYVGLDGPELCIVHHANGVAGLQGQLGGAAVGQEQRGFVTAIAIDEMARRQVEHADEKGDEHEGIVMLDHGGVHLQHDLVGPRLTGSYGVEEVDGAGHEQ